MKEKLLIVEDDDLLRELLGRFFRKEGFDVLEAENTKVAKKIIEFTTDLSGIITDHQMPSETGLEFGLWIIKNKPELKNKIILMTGLKPVECNILHIQKPITINKLNKIGEHFKFLNKNPSQYEREKSEKNLG